MFRFENPIWLILLLIVPILWFYQARRHKTSCLLFSTVNVLKQFTTRAGLVRKWILLASRVIALIVCILALARPQYGVREDVIHVEGIDILLCLDASGSMKALDFTLNDKPAERLAVVKKVAADFIKHRSNDRIGMVIFGKEAVTMCPLTLDYSTLLRFLDHIQVGMAGDMTALGSALALGVKRLNNSRDRSRIIVLLTDGMNNTGPVSPQKATAIARALGIKVYTIGVGTSGIVPFDMETPLGKEPSFRIGDIDEKTLKEIAQAAGGVYFRAGDTGGLKKVFDAINQLEKTRIERKLFTRYRELFPLFLMSGVVILVLAELLTHTLFWKVP